MKTEYTREELISICEKAFVPQDKWHDRDSQSAQTQLGEAYALLKDGCKFTVMVTKDGKGCSTDDRTIWIEIESKGFARFDWGGELERETYYLPSQKRLKDRKGSDWY